MSTTSELEVLRERIAFLENENAALRDIARGSDDEQVYWASTTRNTFHRPMCEWAQYIKPWKLIEFSSHREAREAGYKPCKTCRA